jgi:chromosome segregation protein
MHMSRLRLLGFKSFVEPTELLIEKGLTGVVGPNGCGKSNLLEALRWVMGETSHKSMRAAHMDDVIFAGTNTRPARNWAEVTIFLDNSARTAPSEFNDRDTVEITRRIEREAGSAYRINGRDARARDVKLLFEDAATGARSPALVRQGQIAEIVNAKPDQRRRVLEDAAGVAGLHSRRHEAELRLKAAETNLARLGDLLGQMGTQVEGLKRQARQAKRYKELSHDIRKVEALALHRAWAEAQTSVDRQEAALGTALATLGASVQAESANLRLEAELAASLPKLREEEATRAAIFAQLRIEMAGFEAEVTRAVERQVELKARAAQLVEDREREAAGIAEADDVIARLDDELLVLADQEDGTSDREADVREWLVQLQGKVGAAEAKLATLTQAAVEVRAKRRAQEVGLVTAREATAKLQRQLAVTDEQIRSITAQAPDASALQAAQEAGRAVAADLVTNEAETLAAEQAARTAVQALAKAREANRTAQLKSQQLQTEYATLAKLLRPARADGLPPVLDLLKVTRGYEAALGAALGDDLDAPLSDKAPVHWRQLEPLTGDACLPEGAEPLAAKVKAPAALIRRLKQIGVVDAARGAVLQPALKPGQRLVSRRGDLWRWDGYVAAADAPTAAAQRLAERNRLDDLEAEVADVRGAAEDVAVAEAEAAAAQTEAEAEERRLRQSWRDGQAELSRQREALTVLERQARETASRLETARDAKAMLEDQIVAAATQADEFAAVLDLLKDDQDHADALDAAQADVAAQRDQVAQVRGEIAGFDRERERRAERSRAMRADHQRWQQRRDGAARQLATLDARIAETKTGLDALADLPSLIEERRQKLGIELAESDRARQTAADALAAADTKHRECAQALRLAQAAVATEREARARIEAHLEAARTKRAEEARRIRETLGVTPDGAVHLAQLSDGAKPGSAEEVERQLTRLKADRERLGGVNLHAEAELEALQKQFDGMETEKADVEGAIAKLRGAIGQLNREAKKRLLEAFIIVDGHFRRLFTTLFGGGEARLELIESDDPLAAGLEIIAKPPGKKPATLSLLSGGEQTLTAMSLIFAVFLTNPSPICVLDEVDAPLDDSNVDRFCNLLDAMARDTETRFLVITHHPQTMARTDRLFGVTMGEKGVSQLVSVDLATAEGFREAG